MGKVVVNISWSDKNYCASAEINGIVFVTNKNLDAIKLDFEKAFKFHVDGCINDGDILPEYILKGEYEFNFVMEVSALLHSLDGIVTRSAISRVTGINERQLGHYATGLHNPRPNQRKKIIMGIHNIGNDLSAVV